MSILLRQDTGFVRHSLRRELAAEHRNGDHGDTTDGEMTDRETIERRSYCKYHIQYIYSKTFYSGHVYRTIPCL